MSFLMLIRFVMTLRFCSVLVAVRKRTITETNGKESKLNDVDTLFIGINQNKSLIGT